MVEILSSGQNTANHNCIKILYLTEMLKKKGKTEGYSTKKRVKQASSKETDVEQQTEAFSFDAMGNRVPTGVIFRDEQIHFVKNKMITCLSKQATKENVQNAANQQQSPFIVTNPSGTPFIKTSFRKNDCVTDSQPFVNQLTEIHNSISVPTQSVTNKEQCCQLPKDSSKNITINKINYAKTIGPSANVSGLVQSPKEISANFTEIGKHYTTTIQTLNVPDNYTFSSQLVTSQLNDTQYFVPIQPIEQVVSLEDIPIIMQSCKEQGSKEISNTDPVYDNPVTKSTVSLKNKQHAPHESTSNQTSHHSDDSVASTSNIIDGTSSSEDNDEEEDEEFIRENPANLLNNDIHNKNDDQDENEILDENRTVSNNENLNNLLEKERTLHNHNCCGGCRELLLTLIRKVDENGLLFGTNNNNINRNGNRCIDKTNKFNKLEFLPIDDINTLKEFDKNLAKRDPENVESKTQFSDNISSCGESDMKKLSL